MSDLTAIDADGHIIERESDIRKYLKEPWNRRSTALRPGDQPWDNHMFDSFQSEQVWGKLSPREQVARWHELMDEHQMETAICFPTGSGSIVRLQELPFQIAVARACNDHFAAALQLPHSVADLSLVCDASRNRCSDRARRKCRRCGSGFEAAKGSRQRGRFGVGSPYLTRENCTTCGCISALSKRNLQSWQPRRRVILKKVVQVNDTANNRISAGPWTAGFRSGNAVPDGGRMAYRSIGKALLRRRGQGGGIE
jgi:hypothetical protein